MKINLTTRQGEKLFTRESNEYVLIPEVYWWIIEQGIMPHHVHWHESGYLLPSWIAFKTDKDAVAFKLRWL